MSARHVVVLTGAGISADSGVRTYRDSGGLWEGQRMEDVATPEAWARDPAFVWRFYQLRRAQLGDVEPNAAHRALARLERELAERGERLTLISQNVDDLHQRAGSTVLDMHGQLRRLACEACGARTWNEVDVDENEFITCEACGHSPLRVDVVWFGEVPYHLDEIQSALSRCTHFISIGTSGAVYPAAGLLSIARQVGAQCIVNSLDEPDNLHSDDRFESGSATEVVPRLVDELSA